MLFNSPKKFRQRIINEYCVYRWYPAEGKSCLPGPGHRHLGISQSHDAGGNNGRQCVGGPWRSGNRHNTIDTMIQDALILMCWIQFVNACFWEGMIFGKVGYWMETKIHWLFMPTVGCPICMAPWHGLMMWYFFGINPRAIIIAAGINVIIARWTPLENQSPSWNQTDSNSSEHVIATGEDQHENM